MNSDMNVLAKFIGIAKLPSKTYYKWSELELTFLSPSKIKEMTDVETGKKLPLMQYSLLPKQIDTLIVCTKINMGLMEVPF